MTTNREWLYSLDVADLAAWFDAEHVETEERALDGDTAPENEDSRERLEADVFKAADDMEMFYNGERFIDTRKIIGWLDRQAAITERECLVKSVQGADAMLAAECAELQAKVDELQELNEYHALQYELASEDADRLQAQVDELTAERDNWEANCEDWKKDCERYRELFGKSLDYADAIHALMDDEGMA